MNYYKQEEDEKLYLKYINNISISYALKLDWKLNLTKKIQCDRIYPFFERRGIFYGFIRKI